MLDTELNKPGTLLMHEGKIYVENFDADNCMCREVVAHALLWAIGEMQKELTELIKRPGGSGLCVADLPEEVRKALGMPDW